MTRFRNYMKEILEQMEHVQLGYSFDEFLEIMNEEREFSEEQRDSNDFHSDFRDRMICVDFGFDKSFRIDETFFKKTLAGFVLNHKQNIPEITKNLLHNDRIWDRHKNAVAFYTADYDKNKHLEQDMAKKGYYFSHVLNTNLNDKNGRPSKKMAKHVSEMDHFLDKGNPAHDEFYVYAATKKPKSKIVVFHSYQSSSLDPKIALGHIVQGQGEDKHIIKMRIPKGTKVGRYIGNRSTFGDEKEFLIKRQTVVLIHPNPEKHIDDNGDTLHIWHAEPLTPFNMRYK